MKKKTLLFLVTGIIFSCNSTDEPKENPVSDKDSLIIPSEDTVELKEVDPETVKLPRMAGSWIESNLDNTFFRSKKVDDLVASKNSGPEMPENEAVADWTYDFLSSKEMQNLTVKELIYYCLAYPCSYSQVCAGGASDTTTFPKISGYLPFDYWGEEKSKLQTIEINRRRDSVITVLTGYIEKNPDRISLSYLQLLMDLDAYEAFPAIIKTASEKNPDNYAFLLEYMHKNEVSGLRDLEFYSLLYGEESYRYENKARSTPENRKAVIELAKAYYDDINGE